jgi:two-component system, NtrC family, sensor kinase
MVESAHHAPDRATRGQGASSNAAQAEAAPAVAAKARPASLARPAQLPSIERIIPWRHRFKTKFLGITAAVSIVFVAMLTVAEGRMQEQLLHGQAAGAALFSDTIERATFRAMLEDRRSDAFDVMREIGGQEGVEAVRLLAKDGRVAFSTAEAEVGTVLHNSAEPCRACHAAGTARSDASLAERTRVFGQGGHRVLGLVTPIRNQQRCYTAACHAHRSDEDVLGLLDVSLSLASMDARMASFRRGTLLLTAAGVLLLCMFFFAFAHSNVVRPVQALLEGTRRVAGDELDTEIRVHSKGELGLLGASFNEMTRSLRLAETELHALMLDLERQVEERTADLKRAQAALVQSEKLSSLGRLSASIAHEINNPLAGILTFAKFVIRTLEAGPPDEAARRELVRNLALVQRETERCSAIVRSLLDFARDRPVELRRMNVNAAVEEGLQLIAHQAAIQGLTVEKRLAPTPDVMADFGQLRQAVVNVLLNAVQAMGKSGTLTVATRAAKDGAVEIAVADTGPGIGKDDIPRLFEPFFTTKEKGTGLGLPVVYGILQRHGGQVDVQSERGRGTTFTLRLPPMARARESTEKHEPVSTEGPERPT